MESLKLSLVGCWLREIKAEALIYSLSYLKDGAVVLCTPPCRLLIDGNIFSIKDASKRLFKLVLVLFSIATLHRYKWVDQRGNCL